MATPGQLVSKVSECLGLPKGTVVLHDRNLVGAGLRSKAGRGPVSSARVTARDAANLIVALMACNQVKDSVEAVQRYAATKVHAETSHADAWKGYSVPELASLPAEHSFIDALDAVIAAAAKGSLAGVFHLRVEVQSPAAVGEISIHNGRRGGARTVRYYSPSPDQTSSKMMKQLRMIENAQLWEIGELLS